MNIKLITLGLITAITLSACGGSDEEEITAENGSLSLYDHDNFSIVFPTDWEVTEKEDFPSNVPSSTIVSFQNKIKDEVFTANVHISIIELTDLISSKDFAKSTLAKAKNSLLAFSELSREEISFALNEDQELETFLIEFEGKKTSIEEVVRFKQIYYSHNNLGFTATGAYLPSSDETTINSIDEMLKSLALK
jgi:hypothetical protein